MFSPNPSCWSNTIQRLLVSTPGHRACDKRLQISPSKPKVSNFNQANCSSSSSATSFWRDFVLECILNDLSFSEFRPDSDLHSTSREENGLAKTPQTTSVDNSCDICNSRRRFIRMDKLGVGAVIMYEIPCVCQFPRKRVDLGITDDIAGYRSNSENGGKGIDELLEVMNVNVSYVPLYACTSFLTGQVMNALFHNTTTKDMRPVPAPQGQGFSVDSSSFTLFENGIPAHNTTLLHDVRKLLRPTRSSAHRYRRDQELFSNSESLVPFSTANHVMDHNIHLNLHCDETAASGQNMRPSFEDVPMFSSTVEVLYHEPAVLNHSIVVKHTPASQHSNTLLSQEVFSQAIEHSKSTPPSPTDITRLITTTRATEFFIQSQSISSALSNRSLRTRGSNRSISPVPSLSCIPCIPSVPPVLSASSMESTVSSGSIQSFPSITSVKSVKSRLGSVSSLSCYSMALGSAELGAGAAAGTTVSPSSGTGSTSTSNFNLRLSLNNHTCGNGHRRSLSSNPIPSRPVYRLNGKHTRGESLVRSCLRLKTMPTFNKTNVNLDGGLPFHASLPPLVVKSKNKCKSKSVSMSLSKSSSMTVPQVKVVQVQGQGRLLKIPSPSSFSSSASFSSNSSSLHLYQTKRMKETQNKKGSGGDDGGNGEQKAMATGSVSRRGYNCGLSNANVTDHDLMDTQNPDSGLYQCHDQCSEGDLASYRIPLEWEEDLTAELFSVSSSESCSCSCSYSASTSTSTSASASASVSTSRSGLGSVGDGTSSSNSLRDNVDVDVDGDAYASSAEAESGDVSMCTVSTSASIGPLTPAKGQSLASIQHYGYKLLPSSSDLNLKGPGGAGMGVKGTNYGVEELDVVGMKTKTERRNKLKGIETRLGVGIECDFAVEDLIEMDLGTDVGIVGLDDDDVYGPGFFRDGYGAGVGARVGTRAGFGMGWELKGVDTEGDFFSGGQRARTLNLDLPATHKHASSNTQLSPAPSPSTSHLSLSPRLDFPIPVSSTSLMFPDLLADLNSRKEESTENGGISSTFSSSSFSDRDQVSVLTSPVQKRGLTSVYIQSFKGVDHGFGWTLRKRSNSQTQKQTAVRMAGRGKENIPPLKLHLVESGDFWH
ncbi:hypothetical protein D9758_014130 [Tetrapyrgos nigripes]|uniref:Uncharacterized protein n=1 Tax=Tetrapyrgos nigripes TaxID=182062 RepID=A0A8H5FQ18_9AGAR|nr:hypothetical protein D9758_014130 [Tetrapyrgos nigripes]